MFMRKLLSTAFMLSIGISLNATSLEPSLAPVWWDLKSDQPFVAPLEDVTVHFQLPVKLIQVQNIEVVCDGHTVAEAVSAEVINDKASTGWDGTLIVHFDKQYLPKDRTYRMIIHEGTVGYTESYNDIQIVNMEADIPFSVPGNLGEPEIYAGANIPDSKVITGISYPYETVAVENAKFILYREEEKIGEYSLDILNYPIPLSQIYPVYDEYITFDQQVPYSLVLPAGSISSVYRSDITNEEIRIDFVGCYVEPSLPFSYIWCSIYTAHSDMLGEVTFTYDRPVALTENAKVQLWEGPECDRLVKEVTPWLNTDTNCWLLVADFGGIPLDSENGYTIVIPDGALVSTDEIGVTSGRSQLSIAGSSGVGNIVMTPEDSDYPVYDLLGREVRRLIPGSIYIRNGKKFIYHD